ncbi:MAG: hypothetical protein AB7E05_13325 [Sphingobium sp.]
MTDLVPRIDSAAMAERNVAVRAVPAIPPVQAADGAQAGSSGEDGLGADGGAEGRRQFMASMADYARVQARISQILGDMDGGTQQAVADMTAMASVPNVVVPLPPARMDMLELAEHLARSMARHAQMTRAAQANVDPLSISLIADMAG